ncbi:glycosyltransferase family 4 protein [Exilibacterium tricleocarpae]|uniref:Glycosyltransferase family 4 protein n=1 Tax=Exilibacterium tricleocarpae TaxID=2591008 RepID=A0A545U4B1_9GAMM|nr:glycosyltransferase family 4 protein [Exilibacterium tricleocarpae]TQV84233.1 glycosyltransferase family 4 protein [Exilibacterium tricleocarpae]
MKTKLIFFVTEDWYFCSHRLPIARAAKKNGYDVIVATRVRQHGDVIEKEGFRLLPLTLSRRSINPLSELALLLEIIRIYRKEKPDIVHHVALKPVIYGSIATKFLKNVKVVNAVAGLGFIFSSNRPLARILRPVIKFVYSRLFRNSNSVVIVQNPEDQQLLLQSLSVPDARVKLISGSGVDIKQFKNLREPSGPMVVTLVSRMLWDKGVGEFVNATKILKENGLSFRALLVGKPDSENPASVSREQLLRWQESGLIEWCGHRNDIPAVWAESHIAVLPSYYGEGVPKSLIEAAASGRAIVTTDMPGCREIVRNNRNGLLVPPRDVVALASALEKLMVNEFQRKEMGKCGRQIVEQEFSEELVVAASLDLYKRLLS